MQCPKCQMENPEEAQLCRICNWVLTSTSITAENPDAKTSGLAITALVLAVLSFFTFFITMVPAMIFGLIGLFKIEKSGGQLKGKGLAITGIALPAALLPVFAILMGILMPALARTRTIAYRMVCGVNMNVLGEAMLLYESDFGEFPSTSKWCDLLIEHAEVQELMFRCKGASEGPCNYAMNINIEKSGPNVPPDMVLLFETTGGWNQSGGPEILSTENHGGEGCNVLFVDGHVGFFGLENLDGLKWTAEKKE